MAPAPPKPPPKEPAHRLKYVTVHIRADERVDDALVSELRTRLQDRIAAWKLQRKSAGTYEVRVDASRGPAAPVRVAQIEAKPGAENRLGSITILINVLEASVGGGDSAGAGGGCAGLLCEARVDSDIGPLKSEKAQRRIGPTPVAESATFCEDCGGHTIGLVERLDQLIEAQERHEVRWNRRWALAVSAAGVVVALVSLYVMVYMPQQSNAVPIIVPVESRAEIEPAVLTLSQPDATYLGMSLPMTPNSFAPIPGTEIGVGVGGSLETPGLLFVGLEEGNVHVRPAAPASWILDTAGTVTLLAVTVGGADADTAGPAEALGRAIEAASLGAAPVLPEHMHAVWSGKSFEFVEGRARSAGKEAPEDDFRAWALRLAGVIEDTVGPEWALSGRSFPVEIEHDEDE